jgi:formamidopyrimidine-DNA glycosylase
MEGSWKLYTGKHAGIEVEFSKTSQNSSANSRKILYFHDTRHFGSFNICLNQEDIDFVLKAVGPDLLNEEISFEQYNSVISMEKLKHKEICWFMMEQKFFSGVGNYILAEVLYEAKVLPTRLLETLTEKEKYDLWFYSRKILKESYQYGGVTISTYFGMNGERGIFRVKVYSQKYDPYGNPVMTGVFSNNRTSHYVPAVQK